MTETPLTDELIELLGEDDFVFLCEQRGGTRFYVPGTDREQTDAETDLGSAIMGKLRPLYGSSYLRVPLGRELRARHYRKLGMSHAKIAVRLGMAETSVDRLFARMRKAERASNPIGNDNRQGGAKGKNVR